MQDANDPKPVRPECEGAPGGFPSQWKLSAYLLDELDDNERRALEAHVESCAACQKELELLRATVDAVTASSQVTALPQVEGLEPARRRALLEAAAREGKTPRAAPSRARFYWFAGLAAAAVVAAGLVPVFLETKGDKRVDLADAAGTVSTEIVNEPREEKLAANWSASVGGGEALGEKALREKALGEKVAFGNLSLERQPDSRTQTALEGKELRLEAEQLSYTWGVERKAPSVEVRDLERVASKDEAELSQGGTPQLLRQDARESTSPLTKTNTLYAVKPTGHPTPGGQAGNTDYLRELGRPQRLPEAPPPPAGGPDDGTVAKDLYTLLARGNENGAGRKLAPSVEGAYRYSLPAVQPSPVSDESTEPAVKDEKGGYKEEKDGDYKDKAAGTTARPGETDDAGIKRNGERELRLAAPASTAPATDPRVLIDNVLSKLDRRPEETPDMMFFRYWGDNPFVETAGDPLSTFAVDVDTASYTLMRSYLYKRGLLPPREAIRTEEFINYFKSNYPLPAENQGAFAVHTELAPSFFAHEPQYKLLKVGIKAREVNREARKPCALVFVIDTSGSMGRENRLELVKDSLRLLVNELDEGDSIGMVAFDSTARKVLDPTWAAEKEPILDAISTLHPNNNTNAHAGLTMGYGMAADNLLADGSNRVILLSDGVANTSITDPNGILNEVRSQRSKGIYLTCVGVGMGNHNDALLEQLADNGDGQCVYVDRIDEARKVFVENLTGTLEAIARDVKIQVTFEKERVIRYRLLGYENRAVADAAFRDNTVDAGEVGAGHEMTALYEIKCVPEAEGTLATARVRYQTVEENEAIELEHEVDAASAKGNFLDASPRFQLSALTAEFAEVLRDSYWARGSDLKDVADKTRKLLGDGPGKLGNDPEVIELVALMERANALVKQRRSASDEVARVVDMIKENNYQRVRVAEVIDRDRAADRRHLQELERQQEALRRRLEEILDRQTR